MKNKLSDEKKIELLKYNISRYDHYFASVNFKSSFLVLGNITILGFVLSNRTNIYPNYIFYVLVLLITSSLLAILFAIKPYLKKYKNKDSVIFFNDISNNDFEDFDKKINELSVSIYIKDLKEQTYILAKGLQKKFLYLNIATITFMFTIFIFFLYMGFILKIGGIK